MMGCAHASRTGDDAQGLRRRYDLNTFMLRKVEQIAIAGDDEFGVRGERARQGMIVVGVA